jgi:hypothetical protein
MAPEGLIVVFANVTWDVGFALAAYDGRLRCLRHEPHRLGRRSHRRLDFLERGPSRRDRRDLQHDEMFLTKMYVLFDEGQCEPD